MRKEARTAQKRTHLPPDDGNRRERFPEGGQCAALAPTVVPEDGTGALDPVDEADQALHGRHLRRSPDNPNPPAAEVGLRTTKNSEETDYQSSANEAEMKQIPQQLQQRE